VRIAVISLAIIVDIRLYREGLAEVLCREPDIRVVGTASGDEAGIRRIVRATPYVGGEGSRMPAACDPPWRRSAELVGRVAEQRALATVMNSPDPVGGAVMLAGEAGTGYGLGGLILSPVARRAASFRGIVPP
jgi:DNA-binding NarL/FixJ family response regulator